MNLLVDNGSVRPEAYLNLGAIAAQLSLRIAEPVRPTPLLHADKIPSDKANGLEPQLLETALKQGYDKGIRKFTIFPLFFGPSGAIGEYLPRRLEIMSGKRPGLSVRLLGPLYESASNGGDLLTDILFDRVIAVTSARGLDEFSVVLVDHGSPKSEVTAVRNSLAVSLACRFGNPGIKVLPASMERRKGSEYDFNEPLLERALTEAFKISNNVVVAQLFFSPGRHAGEGGDISGICKSAEKEMPGIGIYRTELVGGHPKLIELLKRRWDEREQVPWKGF